jgi:PIN domain nuclease of toxin-antitoxin system
VSVVRHWEIQVKQLKAPDVLLDEPLENLRDRAAIDPIDLRFAVPHRVADVPAIHGDPFDRMLVAQTLHHDLTLVTGDRLVRRYPVRTFW